VSTAPQTEIAAEREEQGPTPVLEAAHLNLTGPDGLVFTDVSLTVAPARLTLLVGTSGSGRSSLLLALGGRMRGTTGTLRHHGRDVRTRRDLTALRAAASVARIADVIVPEPRLRVREAVAERALLDGVRLAAAEPAFAAAEDLLDVRLDRDALVEQLPAYEAAALAVGLALVRPAEVVLLDDLDADLDLTDQRRLVDALVRLAASGPAVVATTTEARAAHPDAVLQPAAPQEDR
jgi:ABC-2 type transport system ATP-binding protein